MGLVIEPLTEVPADSPPFFNTLILKVLNEYRREDERAALRGSLRYGERFSYTIARDGVAGAKRGAGAQPSANVNVTRGSMCVADGSKAGDTPVSGVQETSINVLRLSCCTRYSNYLTIRFR
jgi:hypothetical protein